ncbi:MAG: hypothetical protein HBSIN02_01960 [Bacteroidia bacterium]|nr:MAG: hypothetical protein HBSIN02_01960 [Bacteroidia bacterium]
MSTPHHTITPSHLAERVIVVVGAFLVFCPTLAVSQFTQWKGVTQEWTSEANWNDGVPTAGKSALISINNQPAKVPVPSSDTARTLNLEVQQGGLLRFDDFGVLIVHGSQFRIAPHGTVDLGRGTVISKGNLTFFNEGYFQAGEGTLEFRGVTWQNKAGSQFDPGTSTVIFNGSGSQSLIIDAASTFSLNSVVILSPFLSITGHLVIAGNCEVAEGSQVFVEAGSSLTIQGTFTGDPSSIGGGGSVTLPVQLTSFTVTAQRLEAVLQWSTATEVNNYGFEIERRRVSGSMNEPWTMVGFVRGAGTSTTPREYAFRDSRIEAGRYAYRLKQVDFGGSYSYTFAADIEIGTAAKELALGSNYPNPFNPETSIEFTVPREGRATLRVFNMIGQEVVTLFDGVAEAGRIHRVTFSGPSLPSGLYFYRLEFGSTTVVKRMMLLK